VRVNSYVMLLMSEWGEVTLFTKIYLTDVTPIRTIHSVILNNIRINRLTAMLL
jgi:hypothetical protein